MTTKTYAWINQHTGRIDYLPGIPETDEQARQYIPQSSAMQNLYVVERERGKSIRDALEAVLMAVAGVSR